MINIDNIRYGWAELRIGYCLFDVSYLSDIKEELNSLFKLNVYDNDNEVNRIVLEGEGQGDLSLVAYLTYDDVNRYLPISRQKGEEDKYDYIINIVWQRIFCNMDDSITIMKFPYKEFMNEYKDLICRIKESYVKDFLCPDSEEEYKKLIEEY